MVERNMFENWVSLNYLPPFEAGFYLIAQANLELKIHLLHPPVCLDYRSSHYTWLT